MKMPPIAFMGNVSFKNADVQAQLPGYAWESYVKNYEAAVERARPELEAIPGYDLDFTIGDGFMGNPIEVAYAKNTANPAAPIRVFKLGESLLPVFESRPGFFRRIISTLSPTSPAPIPERALQKLLFYIKKAITG